MIKMVDFSFLIFFFLFVFILLTHKIVAIFLKSCYSPCQENTLEPPAVKTVFEIQHFLEEQ